MNIRKAKRTRKTVEIQWLEDQAKFSLNERDNPLPKFTEAFDALSAVAVVICHLPKKYTESLRVSGIILGEQGGVETVQLECHKDIDDAMKEFCFKTPPRLLATPTQEGKYTPPLDKNSASLVFAAIEQIKGYVRGERAQGVIAFEKPNESEDGSGEQEPTLGEKMPMTEHDLR